MRRFRSGTNTQKQPNVSINRKLFGIDFTLSGGRRETEEEGEFPFLFLSHWVYVGFGLCLEAHSPPPRRIYIFDSRFNSTILYLSISMGRNVKSALANTRYAGPFGRRQWPKCTTKWNKFKCRIVIMIITVKWRINQIITDRKKVMRM